MSRIRTILAIGGIAGPIVLTPPALALQRAHRAASHPARHAAVAGAQPKEDEVTARTRAVITGILAGKVPGAGLTPAMRSRLTPEKVRSLRGSLSYYGALKSIRLVRRQPGDPDDTCTLRVAMEQTSFIATVKVTKQNQIDDLQLIEE